MEEYKRKILNELHTYKKFTTKAEFARFIGVEPQVLSNWFKRCTFDINVIVNRFPEINKVWLLTGEGEMLRTDEMGAVIKQEGGSDAQYIPILPISAQGGSLNEFICSVRDSDCEHIISPVKDADFAITVSGDSMSPDYPSGSQVIVKKINERAFIEWGRAYVLDTCNGSVIKVLMPSEKDGVVTCVSINKDYPSFEVSLADVYGVYRVLMLMTIK